MGYIIISMPKRETSLRIREVILQSGKYSDMIIAKQGSEILRIAESRELSLVICGPRFSDMGYEELVCSLPRRIPVLLLTKDAALIPFSDAVTKLLLPLRVGDLFDTLEKLVPVSQKKVKAKPTRSAAEKKKIDEAKQLLMDRNSMTEPEAFRYLQKNSMDTGRTMVETAEMILLLYKK